MVGQTAAREGRGSSKVSASTPGGLAPTVWADRKGNAASDFRQIFTEVQRAGGDGGALPHPLEDITDLELEEIRQLKHPPTTVKRVMECVQLILFEAEVPSAEGLAWSTCVRSMVKTDFLRKVRRYTIEELAEKPMLVDHICREYFGPSPTSGAEPLRPVRVKRASEAVCAFFGWTIALIAGVLPDWPEEIGGEEARKVVFELEEQRRQQVREDIERKQEFVRAEAAKEEAKQEAKRKEEERREAERVERERFEEAERERLLREEAERADEELRIELERQEAQRLVVAREREVAELVARERRQKLEKRFLDWCIWNFDGNPERRFLEMQGYTVSFPSDEKVRFCNVVTREPVAEGSVFFEFTIRHLGDEQWLGVTVDPSQAGGRVAGRNLMRTWMYYSGKRWGDSVAFKSESLPALQVGKQHVQNLERLSSGDVVGMLLDADRRAVCFLRNGEVQAACALEGAGSQPFFALAQLCASGDAVELRARLPEEAPPPAREALLAAAPDAPPTVSGGCRDTASPAAGIADGVLFEAVD